MSSGIVTFCTCDKHKEKRKSLADPLCYNSNASTNRNIGYSQYDKMLDTLERYDTKYAYHNIHRLDYWIQKINNNEYINLIVNVIIQLTTYTLPLLDEKYGTNMFVVYQKNKAAIRSIIFDIFIYGYSATRITKDNQEDQAGDSSDDTPTSKKSVHELLNTMKMGAKSKHYTDISMENVSSALLTTCHKSAGGSIHFNMTFEKYKKETNDKLHEGNMKPLTNALVESVTDIFYTYTGSDTPPCVTIAENIEILEVLTHDTVQRDVYNSRASFVVQPDDTHTLLRTMGLDETDVVANNGNDQQMMQYVAMIQAAANIVKKTEEKEEEKKCIPKIEQEKSLIRRINFGEKLHTIQTNQLNCDNIVPKMFDDTIKMIYNILGVPSINSVTNAYNSDKESILQRTMTISTFNEHISRIVTVIAHAIGCESVVRTTMMTEIGTILNSLLSIDEILLEKEKQKQSL